MSSKQFTAKTFAWLRQINHGRYLAIDLKVAFALTSYFTESDHGGRAYPSYKTLGDAIDVSEQTVIRAIDRMRRGGDLYVIPGKPGRGHPNQYWMLLKPPPVDVSDAGKPPRRPARKTSIRDEKTSIAVEENPYKNPKADRECYTLSIRGERDALTRDKKSPSGGSPPLDAGPPRQDVVDPVEPPSAPREKKEKECGGARGIAGGAVVQVDQHRAWGELLAMWRELLAMWQRGHLSDNDPKTLAIGKQVFMKSCREGAEAEEIIDRAKTWVEAFAAGDGVRFLPALPQWLAAKGWEKPPPTKRKRANGSAQRGNGHKPSPYAKPDMFKICLEAGGYREDDDGNLYYPGEDGGGDDDAPIATSMRGGGR